MARKRSQGTQRQVEQGKTWRLIGGKWRLFKDIGCGSFERAQQSRQRVASGYALDYWRYIEARLRGTPFGERLPLEIPLGELPEVGEQPRERREEEDEPTN